MPEFTTAKQKRYADVKFCKHGLNKKFFKCKACAAEETAKLEARQKQRKLDGLGDQKSK